MTDITDNTNIARRSVASPKYLFMLSAAGIMLNLAGKLLSHNTGIPFPLDTVGTMITAVLGGYLPGMITGFVTNIIEGFADTTDFYYSLLNIMTAILAYFLNSRGFFKKPLKILLSVVIMSMAVGLLGAGLTWCLNNFSYGGMSLQLSHYLRTSLGIEGFGAQLAGDIIIELADKGISLLLTLLVVRLLPSKLKTLLSVQQLHHSKADAETRKAIMNAQCRSVSLKRKVIIIFIPAALLIASAAMVISYMLFKTYTINEHKQLGERLTAIAAEAVIPEMVDEYIANGKDSKGYEETEKELIHIKECNPEVEFIYVYKIEEDGCHVVFDLDSGEVEGGEPGDIVPFDESFKPYVPDLLEGKFVEPMITDDTFGWLLTVYRPVYDSFGNCTCYAAVDISMNLLSSYSISFMTKQVSMLAGILAIILAIGVWLVEYNIVLPVNTLAYCAGGFAFNSEEARADSVERMRELSIDTGDEIENLYNAIVKTTEDSMNYVSDIQHKTETISKMQNGLIMVLADMVESRDKCTGDHVRKTAAYVAIIGREMKKRGFYKEQMTDEFISNINNAAPMHDIGKIKISDTILNKPGKLTDEEFEMMKLHTVYGSEIIDRAIAIVPDSDYLVEAKNVSEYHHEKWNGKGYPHGIAGEEIPLSARIMAVADVFDALVSQRSYKKPFTIEKALSIIREDAGSHFDPLVAEAFLGAEEEVRRIAEDFGSQYQAPK